MRQLVLADRQDITRLGMQQLASELFSIRNGAFVDSKLRLQTFLSEFPDAVVVLDFSNFDFQSFEELLAFVEMHQMTDWILFSDSWSDSLLKDAILERELFSAVLKSSSQYEIKTALEWANARKIFLCKDITAKKLAFAKLTKKTDELLTHSEREVLREIASGKMTKVIAADRNLSIHTIMTHRKNIFKKLEINNVHDAIRYAIKAGIIDRDEYSI